MANFHDQFGACYDQGKRSRALEGEEALEEPLDLPEPDFLDPEEEEDPWAGELIFAATEISLLHSSVIQRTGERLLLVVCPVCPCESEPQ